MDTFNDKNLTLQQKEDVAIGISRCVVSELETKNLISKELSEKIMNLLNSADAFLDILISVYTAVIGKNIASVVCGWFGFKCCSSVKPEIPVSIKVEEIKTEIVEEIKIEIVEEIKTEIVEEIKTEIVEEIKTEIVEEIKTEIVEEINCENLDKEIPPLEIIPEEKSE
jgi:hypothetical protein